MSCLAKEVIQEAQIFNMPGTTVATSAATVLNLDLHTATIERYFRAFGAPQSIFQFQLHYLLFSAQTLRPTFAWNAPLMVV